MHFNHFSLGALMLAARYVSAHGWVNSWIIDGVELDGFNPSWVDKFPDSAERPTDNPDHGFAPFTEPIVACGGLSPGENRATWPIKGGSEITANWISDDRFEPNMVWPAEHRGPIMEYMAECPSGSCDGVEAASLDWFKISEKSGSGDQWATDTLNQTRHWTFTIPKNVKAGAYLVRHELVAMHFPGEPQIYPVCFQAKVEGSGTGVPSETVKFPDAYQDFSQDFKEIDIWNQQAFEGEFLPPGPRVADLSGSGSGSGSGSSSSASASSGSAAASSTAAGGSAGSSNSASAGSGAGAGVSTDAAVGTGSDQAASPTAEEGQAQPTDMSATIPTGSTEHDAQEGSVSDGPTSASASADTAGSSMPTGSSGSASAAGSASSSWSGYRGGRGRPSSVSASTCHGPRADRRRRSRTRA